MILLLILQVRHLNVDVGVFQANSNSYRYISTLTGNFSTSLGYDRHWIMNFDNYVLQYFTGLKSCASELLAKMRQI